jgi:alcohol dehydrogenase class IV
MKCLPYKVDPALNTFDFYSPTRIHYGVGSTTKINTLLNHNSSQPPRVVIISDAGVVGAGLVEPVRLTLEQSGATVTVFDAVNCDPRAADIEAAAKIITATAATCVMGVGGGSPMDVAKLAAITAAGGAPCEDFGLAARPLPRRQVVTVMVPTTAGTGAEVTRTAIFSDNRGIKTWAWGDELAPNAAILDPSLTVKLPHHLTAATGMDAIVHAIEACTHRDANPIVKALGFQAIRLVSRHLLPVLNNPTNLEHRGQLSVAATLAGMAINHAGCGVAHAMGHALSSLGKIHHGKAVSLALKAAYRWNLKSAVSIYAEIAHAMGAAANGADPREAAEAGADYFDALIHQTGIDKGLHGCGLTLDDLPRIVAVTMGTENSGMCQANCRPPRGEDIRRMAREVISMLPQSEIRPPDRSTDANNGPTGK